MTQRDDVDAGQISRVVARDVGLTARVLRVANSPFFGVAGQIASIKQASVVLGMTTVRNLAIAVSMSAHFRRVSGRSQRRNMMWRHAIETAIAAQTLLQCKGQECAATFTAGLLHDLGKFTMAVCFPDMVETIEAYQRLHRCEELEAERTVMGTDHGRLGARIAEHWNLPVLMHQGIAGHHEAGHDVSHPIAAVVYLANIASNNKELDDLEERCKKFPQEVLRRLGLDAEKVRDWLQRFESERAVTEMLVNL
jgi:putative nucleotidyltransferase with HDIG domain